MNQDLADSVGIKGTLKQAGKFSIVGIVNTLLGYSLIFLLLFLGANPYLANIVVYSFVILLSFILNRRYVFRSQGQVSLDILKFFALFGLAYFLNLGVLHLLIRTNWNVYLSQVAAGIVYSSCMFILSRSWVFSMKS